MLNKKKAKERHASARWAQETQNVAGVGDAQCQRLLNKVKHISTWRPKARVMIFRQMQFEKQF